MIHFKVIRASKLILSVSVLLLAVVLGGILYSILSANSENDVHTPANLVQAGSYENIEAETDAVFASISQSDILHLDPEMENMFVEVIHENEMPARSVLIYHTHTHEAYEQVSTDWYVAIEAWRTMDQDHSVVRVGEELAEQLRMRGFEVVHDVTDHEQDDLGTAYTRSLATLERYDREFDLYIDLHRDAYIEGVGKLRHTEGETDMAQLMFLIGNGEGFDIKPYYSENLMFAQALTDCINEKHPGLCKNVLVKDGRYNQNIGVFSILVEVGHNRNTLSEALNALPCLADGIHALFVETPDDAILSLQKSRTDG